MCASLHKYSFTRRKFSPRRRKTRASFAGIRFFFPRVVLLARFAYFFMRTRCLEIVKIAASGRPPDPRVPGSTALRSRRLARRRPFLFPYEAVFDLWELSRKKTSPTRPDTSRKRRVRSSPGTRGASKTTEGATGIAGSGVNGGGRGRSASGGPREPRPRPIRSHCGSFFSS